MSGERIECRVVRPNGFVWNLAIALVALSIFVILGCGHAGPVNVIPRYEPETVPSAGTPVSVSMPVDLREFVNSDMRGDAWVPMFRGDMDNHTLTARVIGRIPVNQQELGDNVVLPVGDSLAAWVQKSIVQGLREAGLDAQPASTSPNGIQLKANIISFWMDVQKTENIWLMVECRAEIELVGDLPHLREGFVIRLQRSEGRIESYDWQLTPRQLQNYYLRKVFDSALQDLAIHVSKVQSSDHFKNIAARNEEIQAVPIKRVAPFFPRKALADVISGWVRMKFTVLEDGTVRAPVVLESQPPGVFERNALYAIRRWRFKPKTLNGVAVDSVQTYQLFFDVD